MHADMCFQCDYGMCPSVRLINLTEIASVEDEVKFQKPCLNIDKKWKAQVLQEIVNISTLLHNRTMYAIHTSTQKKLSHKSRHHESQIIETQYYVNKKVECHMNPHIACYEDVKECNWMTVSYKKQTTSIHLLQRVLPIPSQPQLHNAQQQYLLTAPFLIA